MKYRRDVTVSTLPMNLIFQSIQRNCVPFLILALVLCGVGGMYCPMPVSATDAHHSQAASHHSSSSDTTGECPDQLISSVGSLETDDISVGVFSVAAHLWLHDIQQARQKD